MCDVNSTKEIKKGKSSTFLKEHETGFEPAALALARRCSTTEPLVRIYFMPFTRTQDILYTMKKVLSTTFSKKIKYFLWDI